MAGKHDVSQYELVVRPKSARLNKSPEQRAPPSEASHPKLPPPQTTETPGNVPKPNPEPVALTPLPQPSESSNPKLPTPKTPQTPGIVTTAAPKPAQKVHKSVTGQYRRNKSSPLLPTRRSSRLNKSSTELQDEPDDKGAPPEPFVETADVQHDKPEPEPTAPLVQPEPAAPSPRFFWGPNPRVLKRRRAPNQGPSKSEPPNQGPSKLSVAAEPPNQGPSKSEPPKSPTPHSPLTTQVTTKMCDETTRSPLRSVPSAPESLPQPGANWAQPVATQQREAEPSEDTTYSEEDSTHPAVKDDDGGKRGVRRRPLRNCDEAKEASGRELDEENSQGAEGKTTRKRKRRLKSDVRRGRGMAKPRKPAAPEHRPKLMVVGDTEFASTLICTKVVTTVRILTLENMPGPYRTYNMFPSKARLEILKKFLQRYSWGEGEDVQCCLDVFENIASEAYSREMTDVRSKYTKKYGKDKEVWKEFPPQWCKNPDYWKGLCLIWSQEKWDQISTTNRNNKTKRGKVVHHVAGSRSSFRHKQVLGSAVVLKEVFDRIHMKATEAGKVYVNEKAQLAAEHYEDLKQNFGKVMSDEALWELAVAGEDRRGRLSGFGNESRTCKVNQALAAEDATMSDPVKSTATSPLDEKETFTKSQVAVLIAAERRAFANELAAQEDRHRAEFEVFKKIDEYNKACIAALFRATGVPLPTCNEGLSKGNDGGGANEGGEDPQKSHAKD